MFPKCKIPRIHGSWDIIFADLCIDIKFFSAIHIVIHRYQCKVLSSVNSKWGIHVLWAIRNPQIYGFLLNFSPITKRARTLLDNCNEGWLMILATACPRPAYFPSGQMCRSMSSPWVYLAELQSLLKFYVSLSLKHYGSTVLLSTIRPNSPFIYSLVSCSLAGTSFKRVNRAQALDALLHMRISVSTTISPACRDSISFIYWPQN